MYTNRRTKHLACFTAPPDGPTDVILKVVGSRWAKAALDYMVCPVVDF